MKSECSDKSDIKTHQRWATVSGLFVESAFSPAPFCAFVYNYQEQVGIAISLDKSFPGSSATQPAEATPLLQD